MFRWYRDQTLALITCILIILAIINIYKQNLANRLEIEKLLKKVNSSNKHVLNNSNNSTSSTKSIKVGGVDCQLTPCLYTHLQTQPYYTSQMLSGKYNVCKSVTCLDLLVGTNVSACTKVLKNSTLTAVEHQDNVYHNLSCSEFKTSKNFWHFPHSKESEEFPIAFNILLHKSAFQFETLLRALYRPQNSYCVHVDKKVGNSLLKAIQSIIACFSNVFLATKPETIIYAGFSRLNADVNCMSDHLNRFHPFKYLINTATQAFPLKTNEEIVKVLKIYNGSNDIEGLYGYRLSKGRYLNKWIENKKKGRIERSKLKNPAPPHNIDIVRGSAYGIFSKAFVQFIVEDQRAQDLLNWTKNTFSPDEIFWATLHHTYSNPHLHTPGGFSGYPMNKKWLAVYANWGEKPCGGKIVRAICVFGLEDLPRIIGRQELFANKFHHDYQPLTLSCLASWLRFKETCSVPFDDSFYKTLNFIRKSW